MKCPYCGNEMKSGFLGSGQPILWTREKGEGIVGPGREGFRVSTGFWNGCHAEACFCPNCDIIITPVSKRSRES